MSALVVSVGSFIVLGTLLTQKHFEIRHDFARKFGPALSLQADLTLVARQVDLLRLAARTEDSLFNISAAISDQYWPSGILEGGDSLSPKLDSVLLLSNDDLARATLWPDSPARFRFVNDARYGKSARITGHVQYLIPREVDLLTEQQDSELRGKLVTALRSAASTLAQRFATLSRQTRDTTANLTERLRAKLRDPEPSAIFLHGGLEIPALIDTLDSDVSRQLQSALRSSASLQLARRKLPRAAFDSLEPSIERGELDPPSTFPDWPTPLSISDLLDLDHSDTVPFVYLSYPANLLPQDFDVTKRDWFKSAMEIDGSSWSYPYPDMGTGTVVITVSVPVSRHDQTMPVGVVAADFLTAELAAYSGPGTGLLINYLIMLALTMGLASIIASSGRKRFDLLLYALVSLLVFYIVMIVAWLFVEEPGAWTNELPYLYFFFSTLTNVFLISAGFVVFFNFKHLRWQEPMVNTVEKHGLLKIFPTATNFSASLLSAFAVAIASAGLDMLLAWLEITSISLLDWLDAFLSAGSLLVFAYCFVTWLKVYARWAVYLSASILFILYAAMQLTYAFWQADPRFWWIVALLKCACFGNVVVAVFLWTQNATHQRSRRVGSLATVLSRIGVPESFVTIAGVGRNRILFVDKSTLEELQHVPRGRIDDWTNINWLPSDFGPEMLEPKWESVGLTDLFDAASHEAISRAIRTSRCQAGTPDQVSPTGASRITFLKTVEKIEGVEIKMLTKKGSARPIKVVSLVAWQDKYFGDPPMANQILQYQTGWISVLLARWK